MHSNFTEVEQSHEKQSDTSHSYLKTTITISNLSNYHQNGIAHGAMSQSSLAISGTATGTLNGYCYEYFVFTIFYFSKALFSVKMVYLQSWDTNLTILLDQVLTFSVPIMYAALQLLSKSRKH